MKDLVWFTLAISNNDSTSETACEAKGTLAISVTSLASCVIMCAVPSTVSPWMLGRDGRDGDVVDICDGDVGRKELSFMTTTRGVRRCLPLATDRN